MMALAERCIEEGLRMDEHPPIYIRDGASGRRHCLARDSTSPTFVEANPITVLTDALRALTTGGPAVGPVLRSVAWPDAG
jgi:hypothetical protein